MRKVLFISILTLLSTNCFAADGNDTGSGGGHDIMLALPYPNQSQLKKAFQIIYINLEKKKKYIPQEFLKKIQNELDYMYENRLIKVLHVANAHEFVIHIGRKVELWYYETKSEPGSEIYFANSYFLYNKDSADLAVILLENIIHHIVPPEISKQFKYCSIHDESINNEFNYFSTYVADCWARHFILDKSTQDFNAMLSILIGSNSDEAVETQFQLDFEDEDRFQRKHHPMEKYLICDPLEGGVYNMCLDGYEKVKVKNALEEIENTIKYSLQKNTLKLPFSFLTSLFNEVQFYKESYNHSVFSFPDDQFVVVASDEFESLDISKARTLRQLNGPIYISSKILRSDSHTVRSLLLHEILDHVISKETYLTIQKQFSIPSNEFNDIFVVWLFSDNQEQYKFLGGVGEKEILDFFSKNIILNAEKYPNPNRILSEEE